MLWWRLSRVKWNALRVLTRCFTGKMPVPSRKSRVETAATPPFLLAAGFVEAARILGGQPSAPPEATGVTTDAFGAGYFPVIHFLELKRRNVAIRFGVWSDCKSVVSSTGEIFRARVRSQNRKFYRLNFDFHCIDRLEYHPRSEFLGYPTWSSESEARCARRDHATCNIIHCNNIGVPNSADRQNVIAYLAILKGH